MRRTEPSLIFDVGANNGDDTGFYLSKGFRVVAVEADPELCQAIEIRFAMAVRLGMLTVENYAIAGEDGVMTFYVNEFREWSSLAKGSKATTRYSHRAITVPSTTLGRIYAKHGLPYYAKIDIEGGEWQAITSLLEAGGRPEYLSFEVNLDTDSLLNLLSGAGYLKFALVRQGAGFLSSPIEPAREGIFAPAVFTNSMSGLFGKEIRDAWGSLDQLRVALAGVRGRQEGWFDIHAARVD